MWPQQNRHRARWEKAAQFPEILNFLIHRLTPLTSDRPKRTNEHANLCNSLLKRYAIDIRAGSKVMGGKKRLGKVKLQNLVCRSPYTKQPCIRSSGLQFPSVCVCRLFEIPLRGGLSRSSNFHFAQRKGVWSGQDRRTNQVSITGSPIA